MRIVFQAHVEKNVWTALRFAMWHRMSDGIKNVDLYAGVRV